MQILTNFSRIATLEPAFHKDGRNLIPDDLGLIDDGAIIFDDKEIIWVGESSKLPSQYKNLPSTSFAGKTLTPEIVDCHTHLIFGGNRSKEYTMRLNGADYEEIAKAGGGILNSTKGTNQLSSCELLEISRERIKRIHSYGVGTIEIKSGYGLNFEKEEELTRCIHTLKNEFAPQIQIKNTFMAAHAIPKKYSSGRDYILDVAIPLLDKLAPEGIIDAVDIFHEVNYFNREDVVLLFDRCKELNLPVKSHADEFKDNKGAILATEYHALSTDHLLKTANDGILALAKSDTVAVLLPGTGFFLGKEQADAKKFLDSGCKVAIASDYNPGSCHCDNVLLISSLAAPLYKMNIAQLWSSITLNAAHGLGLRYQGALIKGMKPRFSIFETPTLDEITYNWGRNLSHSSTLNN